MAKVITTELQHSGASGANITLDSSKNVTCENNLQVDGNVTVTGTLPADKLTGALPAISGASLTGVTDTLSFRNLIYNGAMTVCQREDSVTSITGSNDGYLVADRWKHTFEDAGTWSVDQVEDAPEGFINSLKIKCTSSATLGANARVYIEQLLESRDQQHYKYGTSNAESLTLSFWIKSSRTGTFNAGFVNQGARSGSPSGTEIADRAISQLVTISSANTWEKKTITFAGDTGAYIRNNQHKGVGLRLTFNAGSNYTGGTAQSWGSNTSANTYTGTLGLGTATNDDLFLTGVQLEIGTTATEFEHRAYSVELDRCMRYLQVFHKKIGVIMRVHSSTQALTHIPLFKPMRNLPTYAIVPSSANYDLLYDGSVLASQSSGWPFSAGGARTGGFELMITRSSGTFSSLNTVLHANLQHGYGPSNSDFHYFATADAEL